MKTIDQILSDVRKFRPISRQHLYRRMKELKIEPLGIRQRPQFYPDDTACVLLAQLGFTVNDASLPTMAQLKAVKAARKGGAK